MSLEFSALVVRRASNDQPASLELESWSDDQLDIGDVEIDVAYAALNYKDALASRGQPGVAGKFPLIPGIDATGVVTKSGDPRFQAGDPVLVAHADFGTQHHGGLAERMRVPADWVYRLPEGLDLAEAAGWGTAGFTAAQSVAALLAQGLVPAAGPIAVSGATGGVGSFAVALLAKLGFEVQAATGKPAQHEWLRQLGAQEVVGREAWQDDSGRPLLKGEFAGAVDSVGGNTLATLLKSTRLGGCVTACGLVGGAELQTTVYPFILRGITLVGIDSANIDRAHRQQLWDRIARDWKIDLQPLIRTVKLDEVPEVLQAMLAGQSLGRTVVSLAPER